MPRTKCNSIELNLNLDADAFKKLLRQERHQGNIYQSYRGSKTQFADAGIPLRLFPGAPGQLKTTTQLVINEGAARLTRLQGKSELYQLLWYIPEHLRATEDPGIDAARAAAHASPARFKVGDACVWWNPGFKNHGEKLEITGGFQFCRINSPTTGRFIDKDGYRFDYRWGYWARAIADRPYFYAAYELRDINYGIRHIRLVGAVRDDTNEISQTAA